MKEITVKPWTRIPDYNSDKEMGSAILGFDHQTCRKCNICTFVCPARSITRDTSPKSWNSGYPYLRNFAPGIAGCIACGCCQAACPHDAITIIQNFMPGDYYARLTQTRNMVWPNLYLPDDSEKAKKMKTGQAPFPENDSEKALPPVSFKQMLRQKWHSLVWIKLAVFGFFSFMIHAFRHKRGIKTLAKFILGQTFDISWARLLEETAADVPDKPCLLYNDERFTYKETDENANRLAHYMASLGLGKGKGMGLILRNSPRFLDIFFGSQKIGMYTVPINPELRGDGLVYIVNHSDITSLAVDAELLDVVMENMDKFDRIKPDRIIVNDVEDEAKAFNIPEGFKRLSDAYAHPPVRPGTRFDPDDICLITYTSGTTGFPKGVAYRYNTSGVLLLTLGGNVFFKKSDVYYTYLALCHGNALFVTVTMSLGVKCTIALSRKFSASRFWDTIRKHNATIFNTIGTIIPILMKQPERPDDRDNPARVVASAACPMDMWEPFEKRFGVKINEVYGAVDGGGKSIMNLGTAPPGSLGKPPLKKLIRIVDENNRDVPDNTTGELLFAIRNKQALVEYYKNEDATENKNKDGWLHTGDIVKRDKKGYLYFIGRNTESMRKGGENVSAYEVEHVIMQHPAVEDVAVFAVPSDLGEDDIMAAIKLVNGNRTEAKDIREYLSGKLAKYAIPRYIRFVDEFRKTNTHRIMKRYLEEQGITEDTYDALNA